LFLPFHFHNAVDAVFSTSLSAFCDILAAAGWCLSSGLVCCWWLLTIDYIWLWLAGVV
jgi:hypothetical protein